MVHVGVSVANLERSIEFYRLLLGVDAEVRADFAGELYGAILALPGARGRVALLKARGAQVELFEFVEPVPRAAPRDRPVCDHGITHFCLEVDDIEFEYQRLKQAGVAFHCAPLSFGAAKATYGRDPDGNVFELVER